MSKRKIKFRFSPTTTIRPPASHHSTAVAQVRPTSSTCYICTALAQMDVDRLEKLHSLVEKRLELYRKAQDFVDSYELSLPGDARDLWPSEASFVTAYPEVFYRFVLPDDPHWTLVAGLVARAFHSSNKTPVIDDHRPSQHSAYRPPMKRKTTP